MQKQYSMFEKTRKVVGEYSLQSCLSEFVFVALASHLEKLSVFYMFYFTYYVAYVFCGHPKFINTNYLIEKESTVEYCGCATKVLITLFVLTMVYQIHASVNIAMQTAKGRQLASNFNGMCFCTLLVSILEYNNLTFCAIYDTRLQAS